MRGALRRCSGGASAASRPGGDVFEIVGSEPVSGVDAVGRKVRWQDPRVVRATSRIVWRMRGGDLASAPGAPEFAQRREVDALMQHLIVAGGDFVHQRQLQRGEGE